MYTVELIVDSLGPNPNYNRKLPQSNTNPKDVTVPAGTVLQGPQAWVHCLPDSHSGVVRATPVGDLTKDKVASAMALRAKIQAEQLAAQEAKLKEQANG